MSLPFTVEQFLGVFEKYNLSIFPMQVLAYLIGLAVLFLIINRKGKDTVVSVLLSLLWLWNGLVYHIIFFSSINKAAYIFGSLFVLQGVLFFFFGVIKSDITFSFKPNLYSSIAGLFILYSMLIYPIVGTMLGHGYPQAPSFGLAPCPTTIFTWGLLLLANQYIPKKLLFIPLIWSLIGFSAALSLGIKEDVGLIIAGIAGCILVIQKNRSYNINTKASHGIELK